MRWTISSDVAPGISQTTVVNLSVDKPFPFTPLTILSPTRITFSFTFMDLEFSFPFPGGAWNVAFSFSIDVGILVVLAGFSSDFEGCLVLEFDGSNCVHLF